MTDQILSPCDFSNLYTKLPGKTGRFCIEIVPAYPFKKKKKKKTALMAALIGQSDGKPNT